MRPRHRVLLALTTVLVLAGCGGTGDRGETASASRSAELGPWVAAVVMCLHKQGWAEAAISPDGQGLTMGTLPAAQGEAFTAARIDCEDQAGPQPNAAPLTRNEVLTWFDHLLTARDCLADLGYESTQPPSQATFVDDYFAGRDPWNPYAELPDLDPGQWTDINQACPQPG